MNLPNLPTDNIYKFITLFGMAIIFYTLLFHTKWTMETYVKIIQIKKEISLIDLEIYHLNKKTEVLQSQTDILAVETDSLMKS